MSDPLRQELLDIFTSRATRRYGLSEINQLQHALQAAALAEADSAPPATVLASLLHDVGHMIHQLGEDPAARGVDLEHVGRDLLTDAHDLVRVRDELVGELGDVREALLRQADVHEGAEGRDLRDRAAHEHTGAQVLDATDEGESRSRP